MPNNASPHRGALRSFITKAIPILFYALLAVFLVVYVAGIDWSQLEGIELSWMPLITATILSLMFRYLGVYIWLRLLKRLGGRSLRSHLGVLSFVYAKSWLGRYIPGAATWILGKIYFAGRHGVPRDKLAVSGVLEGALQIVATMIVGVVLVMFDARAAGFSPWASWVMLAVLVLSVLTLIPPVFHRFLRLVFRLLRRGEPNAEVMPSWGAMGEATGLYVLGALVTGASYYLLVMALYPEVQLSDAMYIVGAASLASAISMLAIFAPGGIGVREGILGLLFATVMPGPIALILVVVIRVWSIAVDLLFFLVAWIFRGRLPAAAIDSAEEREL